MRLLFRVVSIVAVGCAALGAYNVFVDDPSVGVAARREACAGMGSACRARLLRLERSPFRQVFVFTDSGREVEIRCARSFVLVGSFECARQPRVQLRAPPTAAPGG